MKQLFLADMAESSDQDVRFHLVQEWEANMSVIERFDILIAYEHVGSWGCDSSAFYLLRDRNTQRFFAVHGSHCSCYGFENQFEPEECTIEYLQSDKFYVSMGGYDSDDERHRAQIHDYLARLV